MSVSKADGRQWAKWPSLLILVGIILFALALYIPPYDGDFVGDDYVQLEEVASFLDRPLSAYQVFHPFWTTWYYRPVQNITFLAARLLFGLQPFGYYVVLAGWHALTVALLYTVSRKLHIPRFIALCAAALFAVHTHHHDVVSWISSVAIIQMTAVSLLAVLCYLTYLERPGRWGWLLATGLLALLVLTIHEEGVLLLPFLVAVRLTHRRHSGQPAASRPEIIALLILVPILLVYMGLQFTRPNVTIDVSAGGISYYLPYLLPRAISHYLVTILGRWTLLNTVAPGRALLASLEALPLAEMALSAGLLLLVVLWFHAGRRAERLGLLWAALHLGLIYFALWTQRPELFAGRHLYAAWAGLCLALAGGATRVLAQRTAGERRRWRPVLVGAVVLLIALHVWQIGRTNRAWVAHVDEVAQAEAQMKELLPGITPEMRLFAHRFVLVPRFFPATVAAWYGRPGVQGGTLETLQSFEEVTDDFYLLDYADGQFSNLLPGLQEDPRSRPLWNAAPQALQLDEADLVSPLSPGRLRTLEVAGPPGALRLVTMVQPPAEGWAALGYPAGVLEAGAIFRVAVWAPQPAEVRVRAARPGEAADTLYTATVSGNDWQEIALPLDEYQGQSVVIWLDATTGPEQSVYWSNSRIVPQEP